MLFALGGLFSFLFAGITGIMLASTPFDIHVNNTYFVVGHFHYVINGAVVMGFYAAIYHWFPKMTGRMYYEGLGKLHFALTFIGINLIFFTHASARANGHASPGGVLRPRVCLLECDRELGWLFARRFDAAFFVEHVEFLVAR